MLTLRCAGLFSRVNTSESEPRVSPPCAFSEKSTGCLPGARSETGSSSIAKSAEAKRVRRN